MAQIAHAKTKGWLWVVLVVCVAGWFIAGCASYNAQTQKISQSYELGNIQAAASQISAEADKRGEGKDAVIWRLEQGAVLRAAGKLEDSNKAFDKAEELVNEYEEAAKMSVSREALAAVTNLTTLPYEGFAYDKIMMNTYKALNYLELGDFEKARVELNRAFQRQDDAVHINTKRIEKAIEDGNKQNYNVDIAAVNRDSKFKNQFDNFYADLEQFKAYAVYVNPLTVYLDGLYFMTHATGGSDLERSRKSFERVLGMIGENKYIRQDMETLQQVVNGKPISATTYVFFETGQSPEREQIRIDLPLFIITPGVPYVGAAFPKLKYRSNHLSILNVSYKEPVTPKHKGIHPGKKTQEVIKLREKRRGQLVTKETTENTILLSNMDNIIAREFKNELPVIITKTLIASAVKAAVTYGASRAASQKSDTAKYVTLIAGAIYQAATNQADLRTWTSLPKEFHFCRFPTPADRKIELEPPFSGYRLPVSLNDGLINVVWVKSVNRGSPLLVNHFKLRDAVFPPSESTMAKIASSNDTLKSEQVARSSQADTAESEETTRLPQQETHEVEQTIQTQQPETSNHEQSTQEVQPEILKTEQPTLNDKKESSVKQELPVDTAKRMERERFLAMLNTLDETKKQQIISVHREVLNDFEKSDWNAVIQKCKRSLEIDPEDYFACGNLGGAYAMLNEFDLSIEYSTKASNLIPSLPDAYIQMVYAYARKGDTDQAFVSLGKAIDRGFKDINHLRNDTDLPEDFRKDTRLNNY